MEFIRDYATGLLLSNYETLMDDYYEDYWSFNKPFANYSTYFTYSFEAI